MPRSNSREGAEAPSHPFAQAVARFRAARRADDPAFEITIEADMTIPANAVLPRFTWSASLRDAAEAPASAHVAMARASAWSALEGLIVETLTAAIDPGHATAIGLEQVRVVVPAGAVPIAALVVHRPIDMRNSPDARREFGAFMSDAPDPWPAWMREFGALARRIDPFTEDRSLWLVRMLWHEFGKETARLVTTPVIARSADAAVALAAAFEAAGDVRQSNIPIADALMHLSDAHAFPCRSWARREDEVRPAIDAMLRVPAV